MTPYRFERRQVGLRNERYYDSQLNGVVLKDAVPVKIIGRPGGQPIWFLGVPLNKA